MAVPPAPRARALTGSDLAVLIVIGAIVGVGLAVWLTGELAGLIASRPGPPHMFVGGPKPRTRRWRVCRTASDTPHSQSRIAAVPTVRVMTMPGATW